MAIISIVEMKEDKQFGGLSIFATRQSFSHHERKKCVFWIMKIIDETKWNGKFFLNERRQDTSLATRARAKVYLDVTVRASNRLHEFPIIRCTLLGKFVLPYSSTIASGNGNWISCKNRYRVAFDQKNVCMIYVDMCLELNSRSLVASYFYELFC